MADDRVFIVGYMGAGKSSGGARLATALGWPFADTDQVLAEAQGRGIGSLFDSMGESAFRSAEGEVLRRLCSAPGRMVVATGGGTPCFGDHMEFMLDRGTVVYFKVGQEALLERLRANRKNRPLIAGLSGRELSDFVSAHLEEREPMYRRAHIIVDADALDGQRLQSVVQMIRERAGFSP
jgi:shikimate kinase